MKFPPTPQQSLARTEQNQSPLAKLPIMLLTDIRAVSLQEASALHNPVKSNPELQACRTFHFIEAPEVFNTFKNQPWVRCPKPIQAQSVNARVRRVLLVP